MVVGTLMNICDDPTRQVFLSGCTLLISTCVITTALRRQHLPSRLPTALCQMLSPNRTVSRSPCILVAAFPAGKWLGLSAMQQTRGAACRVSIAQEWRENDRVERVPIIVTGNDLSKIFAPLVRDGRMVRVGFRAAAAAVPHATQRQLTNLPSVAAQQQLTQRRLTDPGGSGCPA